MSADSSTRIKLDLIVLLAGLFAVSVGASTAAASIVDAEFDLIFEHITIDDGLPENSVRAVIQDRHGFVWLGTQNGLVRYDGREMVVHAPVQGDSTSFGGRTVDALLEDSRGDIWIGTFLAGLWRHDGELGRFRRVPLQNDPSEPLHVYDIDEGADGLLWVATRRGLVSVDPTTGGVTWYESLNLRDDRGRLSEMAAVVADDRGRIWCGYEGAGVAILDPGTGTVTNIRHDADSEFTLAHDTVYGLAQDRYGRIWAATYGGLSLWRERHGSFVSYQPVADRDTRGVNRLTSLAMDTDGILWVGSAAGLLAFDPDTRRFRIFVHDKDRPTSPVNGPVLSVLVDRSGVVWGGSWHSGLNKADPAASRFQVTEFAMHDGSFTKASVDAIVEDRQERLWLGLADQLHGAGLGRLIRRDRTARDWLEIPARAADGRQLGSVSEILELADGRVIVGTFAGVWMVVDDTLRPLTEAIATDPVLDTASIKGVAQDARGRVWFATWAGALRWDPATGEVHSYRHDADDPASLSSDGLTTVHVAGDGAVWIGADSDGLNRYRSETEDFERFFDPRRGLGTVSDIHEAPDGHLWLASFAGLVEFDPADGSTHVYGLSNGLPNQQIAAILADDGGALWLSTGFGVASFDPRTRDVRTFDVRDGLPDNTVKFARGRTSDGQLHFGGEAGLVTFEPARFQFSEFVPPVVITDVEIADRSLRPAPGTPLERLSHLTESLELAHDRNDIGLAFAALDFSRPDQNRYQYKLDGVDRQWRDPGPARKAVYTGLRPGRYTFRVQASNHDGFWNHEGTALELRVRPPWWQSNTATTIYVVLIFVVFGLIYNRLMAREKARARLAVERAEARKLLEIDDLKTRFLTNITHEFRTPLTLIKVPLQRLRDRLAGEDAESADTMLRNADRLEQLIDQLLDLSRLEAGRLPLVWRQDDCVGFLREFVAGFEPLTAQHGITLEVEAAQRECTAWCDADVMEKIVGNLLTNAVKHTPEGGAVRAEIAAGPERPAATAIPVSSTGPEALVRDLTVTVTNTGSYIPPSEHDRVFDRFHQVSKGGGAGVGLSLVRELTEWLGGSISLSSDADHGTCFTVSVPVFLEHPTGGDTDLAAAAGAESESETVEPDVVPDEDADLDSEPRILVVEDNQELRTFMVRELSREYRVIEAADGEAGLEAAIAEIPDLVLSDVMMPGIDGFELCGRLKEDERTSHVPVILLTARVEDEARQKGLSVGADDYLVKPFNADELWMRIRNLIEQRRKLAERYERQIVSLAPNAMPVESADDRFLVQLRDAVEENLDNPDYSVTDLCKQVAMSRSQLHRKITALTGSSASVFVRVHRLRRAAMLFEGGYGNVTEVAYAVGFANLSHFSRTFKDLHGLSPSEFLRARKQS